MDDEIERLVSNVEALAIGPDDLVVITCPEAVSDATAARLRYEVEHWLGGRKALVLTDGMQIGTLGQHRQLDRIERQLAAISGAIDAILLSLQEEAEPESRTLDGDVFPSRERDQTRPL